MPIDETPSKPRASYKQWPTVLPRLVNCVWNSAISKQVTFSTADGQRADSHTQSPLSRKEGDPPTSRGGSGTQFSEHNEVHGLLRSGFVGRRPCGFAFRHM